MSSDELSKSLDGLHLESSDRDMMHFSWQLYQVFDRTMEVLCRHLKRDFEGNLQHVPANLIFNPLVPDHAFWIDLGKGYGANMTKDSIEVLKRFERWLLRWDFQKLSPDKQKKIDMQLPVLSGPLFYLVADAIRSKETNQLLLAINLVIEHLETCVSSEFGVAGNYRARRTAVALRAIFETYSDLPARSGDKWGVPTGPFCNCLEEIFKIGRIEGGFRHFATIARDLSPCDPLLVHLKQELLDGPARVAVQKADY